MVFNSHKQDSAWSRIYRKGFLTITCSLLLAGVSGCDFTMPQQNSDNPFARNHQTPDEPTEVGGKTQLSLKDAQNVAVQASAEDGMSMDASLPMKQELAAAKGLNRTLLFTTPMKDGFQRLDRIEGAVQDIRDQVDKTAPSIERLVAIEQDIQDLIGQLEVLLTEEDGQTGTTANAPQSLNNAMSRNSTPSHAPATILPKAMNAPVIHKKITKPTASATKHKIIDSSARMIDKVRIGDHKIKTRIVLETSQKMNYTMDIDNNEKLFTLFFDTGDVAHQAIPSRIRSKMIDSVSRSSQNGSAILAFGLKKSARIIGKGRIAPNKDTPYHRIFIDVAP